MAKAVHLSKSVGILFLMLVSLFSEKMGAQEISTNRIINDSVTYPSATLNSNDVKLTVNGVLTIDNNLVLKSKGTSVEVNGKLVVMGDLLMDGNESSLNLTAGSVVVIYGNVVASNKVTISANSFFVVYGNFERSAGSDFGNANFDNGNVFILGEVDPVWGLTTCLEPGPEGCDYGTEEDLVEVDLPPGVGMIDCIEILGITNQTVCPNATATFSATPIAGVTYRWQQKSGADTWMTIPGATTETLSIPNVGQPEVNTSYRLVVTRTSGDCRVGFSDPYTINLRSGGAVWNGSSSTEWNNTSNWNCGVVPNGTSEVTIPSGLGNYPLVTGTAYAKNLNIEKNGSVIVTGTLEISGSINNTGTLDLTNGSLSFAGAGAQILPAGSLTGNTLSNLYINNPTSVSLAGTTLLTGILRTSKGTLLTNDHLTLISNANQTALISGTGTGQVIGNVTIQRFINPAFGYKYFSSPISNATVGDFSSFLSLIGPNNFPHFFRYNENRKDSFNRPSTGWEAYTLATNPLNVLEGYAANFGTNSSAVTISFSGEVNNGDYSRTLSNNAGTYTQGFNLVGNPYPSPIDWNSSGWTKSNIDKAIYFFTADASDEYVGTYTSYVEGVSSDGISSNIIPSMQGFFVHVSNGFTQTTLTAKNTVRVEDFGQPFLKSKVSKEIQVLRLSAGFEGESVTDPLAVYFGEPGSESFSSQKDALKLMNTNPKVPSLYSLTSEEKELSIDAISRRSSEDKIRIPLGLQLEQSGTVNFNLSSLGEDFTDYHIYLVDQQKDIVTKMDLKETYSVKMEKGTHNSRFLLLLTRTAVLDTEALLERSFIAKATGNGIKILVNLQPGETGQISVSNLSGQVLKSLTVKDQKEVLIEGIKSSGIYIVSMKSGDTRTTRKILINK